MEYVLTNKSAKCVSRFPYLRAAFQYVLSISTSDAEQILSFAVQTRTALTFFFPILAGQICEDREEEGQGCWCGKASIDLPGVYTLV